MQDRRVEWFVGSWAAVYAQLPVAHVCGSPDETQFLVVMQQVIDLEILNHALPGKKNQRCQNCWGGAYSAVWIFSPIFFFASLASQLRSTSWDRLSFAISPKMESCRRSRALEVHVSLWQLVASGCFKPKPPAVHRPFVYFRRCAFWARGFCWPGRSIWSRRPVPWVNLSVGLPNEASAAEGSSWMGRSW